MPPREATGAFPDQYLTFDYDASAPVVLPHDPPPMGGGTNGVENDDQSFGDQQANDDGGDGANTGAQNTQLGPLQGGGSNDGNDNSADPQSSLNSTGDGTSSYGANAATALVQPSSSSSSQPNVDPLSIDPTLDEPPASPWSTDVHHQMGGVPMDSMNVHPQQQQPVPTHLTSTPTRPRTLGRYLLSMSSTVEAQHHQADTSSSSHHVQTGLTAVNTITAPYPSPTLVSPYASYVQTSHTAPSVSPPSVGPPNSALIPRPFPVRRASSTETSSSNDSNTSAPLSTGSSVLHATTAPNSPFNPANRVTPSIGQVPSTSGSPPPQPGSPIPIGTNLVTGDLSPSSAGSRHSSTRLSSRRHRSYGSGGHGGRPLTSVLDSATSLESDDEDDDAAAHEEPSENVPDLDTTNDSGTTVPPSEDDCSESDASQLHHSPSSHHHGAVVTDEDCSHTSSAASHSTTGSMAFAPSAHPSPGSRSTSSSSSSSTSGSIRMLHRNPAFDLSADHTANTVIQNHHDGNYTPLPPPTNGSTAPPSSPIHLSFGPNTTVSDLKYFAERGCIVALLAALTTPRLKTLGTRMLADYAKMPNRRVAVASNRRILEFVQRTMLDLGNHNDGCSEEERCEYATPEWLGREYAVETVRSLTATEESDTYLMGSPGLLKTLSLVARGGPFVTQLEHSTSGGMRHRTAGLASGKARLHACIAVMNLSCGKANKIEIAKVPEVLESMRDVMVGAHFPPPGSNATTTTGGNTTAEEARLKATTCVKNLSNADANDGALLGTPGLVEALGHVAAATCTATGGATTCTTNACLALMNLSISKSNKHRVFRTPGVMEALMAVITRTTPGTGDGSPASRGANDEARVKACSALSNLAIGYDNKIPMFAYPGFVDAILHVIETDGGEARTKACSILWSFAAEMKNQVPVVQRGDILPTLVRVAEEDGTTEARFKCVAALTLLAESLENAIPLLESGALAPLMDILHDAGPDPTQWKGQTASWCVGFLMNMAQSDEAVPALREAGVVELLAPLLTLDHYQSLKAAMAVTFVCRYDEGDETYDLLRKTENVIPKIISLLHNTLSGRGGNGYKYGVFTLRSSVGCIASLASGPDFMKERIATGPVFESLLRVISDFCVDGGTPGAIVGGGRDDALSATLAIRALQSLTGHLIPIPGSSALPFGPVMDERLLTALIAFEGCPHGEIRDETRHLATDAKIRIQGSKKVSQSKNSSRGLSSSKVNCNRGHVEDVGVASVAASLVQNCCGLDALPGMGGDFLQAMSFPQQPQPTQHNTLENLPTGGLVRQTSAGSQQGMEIIEVHEAPASPSSPSRSSQGAVRTFLLADSRTGRRFAVPTDPSGGRAFNDSRVWCYRRGRFCLPGEVPDPNFRWTDELQAAYVAALAGQRRIQSSSSSSSGSGSVTSSPVRRGSNRASPVQSPVGLGQQ